jgi:adenylylsulfate kinase-like enzyme
VAWHGRNQESFPINFQDVYERAILQRNILSDIEQSDQSAKRVNVIETTKFIILMGVTGSGKTTIGKALAERLGWDFFDGDDFHSIENIQKMSHGIPLTDEDRADWLNALAGLIHRQLENREHGILACSALKQRYGRGSPRLEMQ